MNFVILGVTLTFTSLYYVYASLVFIIPTFRQDCLSISSISDKKLNNIAVKFNIDSNLRYQPLFTFI